MRMVEDGNGRARAGRGRMKWRGKVVLSFGGGFIGVAVAAWDVVEMLVRGSQTFDSQLNLVQFKAVVCRHFIEHVLCMHGDCFDAEGGNADFG
uniref:Uncharacterized protein n=1 Tax=Oryza punctata TaxID=4537 RepID=A0A0E0K3G0_ORYPU